MLPMCLAMLFVSQAGAFSIPTLSPLGLRPASVCRRGFVGPLPGGRAKTLALSLSMAGTMEKADEWKEVGKFSADTHPPYGETGGAQLLMEDVLISRGDRDLMIGVNLRLTAGERVGLVGPNGAGKSTLLSAAAGRLPVKGKVLVKPGMSLGYLIQTAVSGSERSCWEEASSQAHILRSPLDSD
jgi:hypothetical protein